MVLLHGRKGETENFYRLKCTMDNLHLELYGLEECFKNFKKLLIGFPFFSRTMNKDFQSF